MEVSRTLYKLPSGTYAIRESSRGDFAVYNVRASRKVYEFGVNLERALAVIDAIRDERPIPPVFEISSPKVLTGVT